ncbi:unnamed protein product [Trifolium pratense]|uniref:Uncharacterized protein n=1 Tax=Trifolium pratense TaxID=57577 RepID=A0ACB0KCF6_TRIPR|nr:unnamed protein product [Trifolium pratense]
MSIISWNCRGFGNLSSVPKFKYLIRYYNPDAIFLCETLVHRNKIEELRILLGFENCFAVDREGRGGGVALLWKSTIHCNITNYSSNHINVEIDDAHRGTWRLTGFYGYPGGSRRRDSWNFLRRLSQSSQLPWCIIGDFNDILDAIEKKGRSERPNWLINGFRQAVLDSGLSDVHMDGYPFTWFKSLGTPRAVEERLDRALANEAWFQLFPNAKLENLVAPASDHYPILLDRDPIIRSCRARRKFKFENAWCIETELDDVVHRSWLSTLERPIMPRLEVCAEDLSQWSKNHCHNFKKEIEDCRKKLQQARDQDDCFLFFRADEHEAYIMKNILSTYEAASGQAISFPKSEIFCSRNVPQVVQNSITNILGVQAVLGTGKYLGLPSMVGRSKKETFNYIKDRVWRKINSWSSKCLSKAGREVLIKSVLQAIPSYVMSIFLILGSLIDAIEKMMNSFWWGHGGSNNKGIHWLAWDKLSVHKNKGGMGFKDLTAFNIAMLGKQGWKFQSSPNSLVSRLFKARYFPHSNFLASSLGHNPSYVWRSISSAKFLVRAGARWCIGSGENIYILGEPWIQGGTLISASNPSVMHLQNIKVKHLISNTTKEWDSHVINNIFDQGTADAILRTPLFQQVTSDKLVWKAEKKGNYTVKSAYRLCVEELLDTSHLSRPGFWSGIWRLKVPPKVKNLLWRICRGCFPTRARLRDKGIQCPSNCVVCDDNYEDTGHILFDCPLSIRAWRSIGLWEKVEAAVKTTTTAATSIFLLLQQLDEQQATHMAALMWSIWKHRNLKLWQDVTETSSQVVARAIKLIEDWNNAHKAASRQQPEGTRSDNSNASELRSIDRSVQAPIRWRKPATGRYKCNIDASFSSHSNQVGIGICIRDDEGRYVLAKSMWLSPICNVDIGEALGLFHAIKWVSELQLDAVDFALDSKLVVDYFNKGGCDITEFGDIIGGISEA